MGKKENPAQRVAGYQQYTNHSDVWKQKYGMPSAVAPPVVSKKKTKANTLTDDEREILRQQVLIPELQQSALARSKPSEVADKIVCPTCGPADREISSKASKSKAVHRGSKIHQECWDARQQPWKEAFSSWAPPCPANADLASSASPAAATAVKSVSKSSRSGQKRKADEDLDNPALGSPVPAVAVSGPVRDIKAIRKRQKLVAQSARASSASLQSQANDTVVADRNAPDDDDDGEDFLKDAFDDEGSAVQADRSVLDDDDDDEDDFLEGQIEEVSASDLGQLSGASTEALVSIKGQAVKTLADRESKHAQAAIAGVVEAVSLAASLPSIKNATAEEGDDPDDDLKEVVVEPCLEVNKDVTAEEEDKEDDEDDGGDWEEVVPGQAVSLEVNENTSTVQGALQETLAQTWPVVESGHLKIALADVAACSTQSVGGTSVDGDEDEDEDEPESDVEPTEGGAVEDSSSDDSDDSDED